MAPILAAFLFFLHVNEISSHSPHHRHHHLKKATFERGREKPDKDKETSTKEKEDDASVPGPSSLTSVTSDGSPTGERVFEVFHGDEKEDQNYELREVFRSVVGVKCPDKYIDDLMILINDLLKFDLEKGEILDQMGSGKGEKVAKFDGDDLSSFIHEVYGEERERSLAHMATDEHNLFMNSGGIKRKEFVGAPQVQQHLTHRSKLSDFEKNFRLLNKSEVQKAGEEGIDRIFDIVKGAFSEDQLLEWDQDLLKEHYELLRIEALVQTDKFVNLVKEKVWLGLKDKRPKGLVEEYSNPQAFLEKLCSCGKDNTILKNVAAEYLDVRNARDGTLFPNPTEDANKYIVRSAIHYTLVLDLLNTAIRLDPSDSSPKTFYAQLDDALKEIRDETGKNHTGLQTTNTGKGFKESADGLFEYLKIKSITGLRKYKTKKEAIPRITLGWKLAMNILEANLQDYVEGYVDNAEAGYHLMIRTDGFQPQLENLGNKNSEGDDGVVKMFPPLPKEWADVYQSWNMAFILRYKNHPFFFAKLLNPPTFCYKDTPELYLYNRASTLYIHIHWLMAARMEGKFENMDWTESKIRKRWGAINRLKAGDYATTVNSILRVAGESTKITGSNRAFHIIYKYSKDSFYWINKSTKYVGPVLGYIRGWLHSATAATSGQLAQIAAGVSSVSTGLWGSIAGVFGL